VSDIVITEATTSIVTLTESQAAELIEAGRSLRGSVAYWRSNDEDESESGVIGIAGSTAISVRPRGGDIYDVRPHNIVGVIGLTGAQLIIEPKIPRSHFFHLLARAGPTFRPALRNALVGTGESLKELVATWYVEEIDLLLRGGLLRDYNPRQGELAMVRGSIMVVPTTRNLLSGKLRVECRYEEFEEDTPLNRVLLEAMRLVAIDVHLSETLRRQARRGMARFDHVGAYRRSDLGALGATLERRAARYAAPVQLAGLILKNAALTPDSGGVLGRTFVVPTAPLVEAAIRNVLSEHLGVRVEKRSAVAVMLPPRTGTLSFDPDLVIDHGRLVGDVKYRVARSSDWQSPERNQLLAFAAAFGSRKAVVVGFASDPAHTPPGLIVGPSNPVEIHAINWDCSIGQDPAISERKVIDAVTKIL